MPTYDYRCDNPKCRHIDTIFYKSRYNVTDSYLCKCCNTGTMVKLMSAVPHRFDMKPIRVLPGGSRGGGGNS